MFDDVGDAMGAQERGRWCDVSRCGELQAQGDTLVGLQQRPDLVDHDDASLARSRGPVGQLRQPDLGDEARDVRLRDARIAQVKQRAGPTQGDGGAGIEDPGQRPMGEVLETFDELAGRRTVGVVRPVAGRDLAYEVGGGGRATAVGRGIRRLDLALAVGRCKRTGSSRTPSAVACLSHAYPAVGAIQTWGQTARRFESDVLTSATDSAR